MQGKIGCIVEVLNFNLASLFLHCHLDNNFPIDEELCKIYGQTTQLPGNTHHVTWRISGKRLTVY